MILPTKRIAEERSLLGIGGQILRLLDEPKTVSRLWDEFKAGTQKDSAASQVTYDWFVLSLDLLFILGAICLERGLVKRNNA